MSVTRQTTVWCDSPGCEEWHQGGGGPANARHEARQLGWSRIMTRRPARGLIEHRMIDLCPNHAAGVEL